MNKCLIPHEEKTTTLVGILILARLLQEYLQIDHQLILTN